VKFKEVHIVHWQSENGRFIINNAYPSGFCAKDTLVSDDLGEDCVKAFFDTFDEAVTWCEARTKR
jgi:hypothetical protein